MLWTWVRTVFGLIPRGRAIASPLAPCTRSVNTSRSLGASCSAIRAAFSSSERPLPELSRRGKHDLSRGDRSHRLDELFHRRVLRDVAVEPDLQRLLDGPVIVARGERQDLRIGEALKDGLAGGETALIREAEIHEDQVGRSRSTATKHVLRGRGHGHDAHALPLEGGSDRVREERMIVDDQDANRSLLSSMEGSSSRKLAPDRVDRRPIEPPCASSTRRAMNSPSRARRASSPCPTRLARTGRRRVGVPSEGHRVPVGDRHAASVPGRWVARR